MICSKVGAVYLSLLMVAGFASKAALGQILKDYLPEPPPVSREADSLSSFNQALNDLQKRDAERDKAVRPRTRHDDPLEKTVPGGIMQPPTK
jgi:hypothetical protein